MGDAAEGAEGLARSPQAFGAFGKYTSSFPGRVGPLPLCQLQFSILGLEWPRPPRCSTRSSDLGFVGFLHPMG